MQKEDTPDKPKSQELICPECEESCPGDDRVKAGLKCYACAYPQAFSWMKPLEVFKKALSEADLSDQANEAHITIKKERLE